MKLIRMTLRTALRALWRNRMRSALTMLGIVIGVAAVIAMVSIGQGADAAVQSQIRSLGTNLLMVVPGATTSAGVRSGWGGVSTLTAADAAAIRRECPAVAEVTHFRREVSQVVFANQNWSTAVQGATPSFFVVREWPLAAGQAYSARDEETAARVAVLGQTVVEMLFGVGQDPIGSTIRIKNVPFRVIGVLEPKGQTMWGQDQDDVVLVPFKTAERRLRGAEIVGMVDMIHVTAVDGDHVEDASRQISTVLRRRHRIQPGEDDDFTIRSMSDMARASQMASQVMSNLLLSVAAISLVVGGIGIMNILLVSVTERTREIGIRRAVGAKSRHILLQFLVEAATLGMIGGALGVLLGIGAAAVVARLANWPALLSPGAIAGAWLFSGAVGVFFGFYPARKAARLDPIMALRYE